MNDFEFELTDRVQKIKSIDAKFDLRNNSFISFSGGKDSLTVSRLIDEALPDNLIPRVYLNTGIEYKMMLEFVRELAQRDKRIVIVNSGINISRMLEQEGYPFKSKEHSQKVSYYQKSGMTQTVKNYLGMGTKKDFLCPAKLKYNFTEKFKLKVSDKCCYRLKKEVAEKWQKENKKSVTITGIRQSEKGLRQSVKGCAIFTDDTCKELRKFHPIFPCSEKWIEWYIKERKIELCRLYYPPFNFQRTGCKGCPYSLDLQKQLEIMTVYLPQEKKQCEQIWGKVYAEYRKINYRLDKQLSLF